MEHIEKAVRKAEFTDVYKNRFGSTELLHLYQSKQRCSLSSTDAIRVHDNALRSLWLELENLLGTCRSPILVWLGNGLYLLTGSLASPRLPSTEDFAKILVLAASRIGAKRVAELLADWIEGKGIRVWSCVLLKGLKTERKLHL